MNPRQKLESAVAEYLETPTLGISIPIYKGIENPSPVDTDPAKPGREVPCATVAVESDLTEAIPFTGNWEGDLIVSVESDSNNTTDSGFDALCRSVFDPLNKQGIAATISASADNFTILFFQITGESGRISQGGNWIVSILIHVVFCESDM